MKSAIKLALLGLMTTLCLSIGNQAEAATNDAVNDAAASFDLQNSGLVTINPLATPQLVKAVYDGTSACVASDDGPDPDCNNALAVSIPATTVLTFVIYVANPSGVTLNDIRFNDVLDIVTPDGFVYQAGSLTYGTRLVAGADKNNIYTTARSTVATDDIDGDGAPFAADPVGFDGTDTVSAGGIGGDGSNTTVNVAPGEIFAIAFDAQYL